MKIIKRKDYLYLAHSFRSGKGVLYRERYLGRQVPEGIEDIKESFLRKCMQESLFKRLNLIQKNFRKEWKRYPESIKRKILIDFSVSFTYNTNAIEGSTVTFEETEDIIKRKISPNRPINEVRETISHSKVFFEALNETKQLSLALLLRWHNGLFSETKPDIAGNVRDYHVRVGDYRAPDWQDLKGLLKGFFGWIEKSSRVMHSVELAARAHYKFEKIHPFGDGNGRVGRLIVLYFLKKYGFPLFVIEHKKRKAYYRALSKDENYFLQYFIRSFIKANKRYIIEK